MITDSRQWQSDKESRELTARELRRKHCFNRFSRQPESRLALHIATKF